MLVPCISCPNMVDRMNGNKGARCFNCKRKRANQYYIDRKRKLGKVRKIYA